jgi:transposase
VKVEPCAPTCAELMDLIGKLYEIERDLPNPHALEGAAREAALTHLRSIRQERSVPIVAEIKAWATRQQALPESTVAKPSSTCWTCGTD